jgi:hypothetical protein
MTPGGSVRYAWRILATVALLVLVAAPASAKRGEEPEPVAVITISGPGLDGPILINGDRAWRVLYLSAFRGVGLAEAEPPPAERLGPPFDAQYRFVQPSGDVQTLRQSLYPCADGRTWTFTPAGQDRVLQRVGSFFSLVQTGWWHSVALAGVIGADELRSACREAGEISAAASPTAPGSWVGLGTGLGAVALLATVGALARGAIRRRQPVGA